jgi:hypothetical protein
LAQVTSQVVDPNKDEERPAKQVAHDPFFSVVPGMQLEEHLKAGINSEKR